MLIEQDVIHEPKACSVKVPGGCGTNWIANHSFGYLTIPTLALTAFLLIIGFLVLGGVGGWDEAATTAEDSKLYLVGPRSGTSQQAHRMCSVLSRDLPPV